MKTLPPFKIAKAHSNFPVSRFEQARILIVDDLHLNLKLIEIGLTNAGYLVHKTAVDGEDAIVKTYEFKPDIVLLDLMMPKMDGFGYCEKIRSYTNVPKFPIIVQTALNDRDSKLRALSCGADDFVNKPLDMDELNLRVHLHLERYFTMQDMDTMRSYLNMELEQAKGTIQKMGDDAIDPAAKTLINKHYEVLGLMAIDPKPH